MIYKIESKSDLSGAMLVIRFPEQELDKKALYTIEHDPPGFLVPFSYRSVDGMVECTYRLTNRNKLQYSFGSHSVEQYVELWSQVLQPLLECGDWFLKPFSFVLDTRCLYTDRSGNVSYLYVPALQDCESFETLHSFAMELSQHNSVADPALENKVLRAIMQDFQPKSFLTMLRSYKSADQAAGETPPARRQEREERRADIHLPEQLRPAPEEPQPAPPAAPSAPEPALGDHEIMIQMPVQGKGKPEKKHKPLFGGKKEKAAAGKEAKAKERKPLFGGKKGAADELILGAAAQPAPREQERMEARPGVSYEDESEDAVTQLEEEAAGVCRLRLESRANLPQEIVVDIEPGQAFTIGRFDISVGRRQSSFEFPKDTKAVSRRHAAIERETAQRYVIVDLASTAGTFVNGSRLIPNVPQEISGGSRISFGTGGADYIWIE